MVTVVYVDSMNQVKVSIIIVNFNGGKLLSDCVRSALNSTVSVEVFVSDNGSADGSIEHLREMVEDNRLHIILNRENLGFSKANNIPLSNSSGKYFLFLNPDCIVEPDTLERMISVMDSASKAGMAGCLIRNWDGSEQAGCRRMVPTPARTLVRMLHLDKPFPFLREKGVFLHQQPLPKSTVEIEAISGAFMLVSRNALEDVGPLDEEYFLHCEDLDWCMRFRKKDWRILFVPDVLVHHAKGECSTGRPVRVEWHKHKGMVRFYLKHFRHQYPFILMWAVIIAVWARFLLKASYISFRRVFSTQHAIKQQGVELLSGSSSVPTKITDRNTPDKRVLVTGATSMIGDFLLPMLVQAGYEVIATSRKPHPAQSGVNWIVADLNTDTWLDDLGKIDLWVNFASLKYLPDLFSSAVQRLGVKRLVAFSSTSRFTKVDALGEHDRNLALSLVENEAIVQRLCEDNGVSWTILRPTLIYCLGRDRNITLIDQKIRQFSFFPLIGSCQGMRQPVHAEDLAKACIQLLDSGKGLDKAYNLSGDEILSYRAMVERLFEKQGKKPRFVRIPLWMLRSVISLIRAFPRYRYLTPDMADRMQRDMLFSHENASRDFGFSPRKFEP